MTEWFYARNGQQNGPVTFEQLVELAGNGGLDAAKDSVWNASMQGWTPAGQVPGIFSVGNERAVPPVNTANPYAAPQSNWGEFVPEAGIALQEISYGSDPIDPADCMSRGIELVKRQFGNILLVGIVYIACIIGLSLVANLFELLIRAGGQNSDSNSLILAFVISSQLLIQVVTLFLKLGMLQVGLNLVSGKEVSIGLIFGQGSKLIRAILASIVFAIAILLGLILLIVPGIYIACRYGQYLTAIVERDLGIMEAFEYSSSITTGSRMNLFLLGLLSMLAIIIGLIPCGLGLIFIGPVVWLAGLVAYRWMQYGRDATRDHPGTQIPILNSL